MTRIRTPTFENNNNLRSNRSGATVSSNVKGASHHMESGQRLNNVTLNPNANEGFLANNNNGNGTTEKERKKKK